MTWEDLKDDPTFDLIDYVKSLSDPSYKELGEAAFVVLTFRYRADLIDKCVVLMRKWKRTEEDAIELSNRVFARFLKYPRYNHEECKTGKIDECFRRYLFGIANREIINLLNPNISPYDGSEHLVTSLIDVTKEYEPEKLKALTAYEKKLDEIFEKLTPKHKIIFLTYKQYEVEGRTLPRHLLTELRDTLGLAQNSIRVYKNEAYELVNKDLKNG